MTKILNSSVIATFDRLAKTYSNKFVDDNIEKEKIISLVKLWQIKKGFRVLEVGGGTGDLTPYLMDKIGSEGKLVFMDIASEMINVAEKKLKKYKNIVFLNQDIHEFSDEDKFDRIIIFNTFPHFVDKKLALEKCFEALRKKGKLIISHNSSRSTISLHHQKKGIENKISVFPEDRVIYKILVEIGYDIEVFENNEGYDYYLVRVKKF